MDGMTKMQYSPISLIRKMVFEDIVLSSSGGAAGSTIPLFPTTTGNSLFPQSTVVLGYRLIVPKSSGLQAIQAIWLGWYGWGYLRRIGWIEQTRVIDVHLRGDWITGEYRPCQTDGRADVLFCPNPLESQTSLAASEQMPPSFSVGFYGNITGKQEETLKWICRRETDTISCHAVR
jgi:hypothetical protein